VRDGKDERAEFTIDSRPHAHRVHFPTPARARVRRRGRHAMMPRLGWPALLLLAHGEQGGVTGWCAKSRRRETTPLGGALAVFFFLLPQPPPPFSSTAASSTAAARPLANFTSSTPSLTPLPLCDCRPAAAASDLACSREGAVVVGFQREGQWVAGGGGTVPLSPALCCRVCLEEEEEEEEGGSGGGGPSPPSPVAVVSANCRPPGEGGRGDDALVSCAATTGGLVVGFASASPAPTLGPGVAFPLGGPTCCTPALLFPDGTLLDTTPCDCAPAPHGGVSCGNGSDGRALRGFGGLRVSLGGDVVPAGPAQCCRACVEGGGGPAPPPEGGRLPRDCGVGGCGPHGACIRGGCVCSPGWSGPGCGARAGDGGSGWWEVLEALLSVVGVVAMPSFGGAVFRGLADAARELVEVLTGDGGDGGSEGGDGAAAGDDAAAGALGEPLIVRLAGGAGSVGSVDTDAEEDEEEAGEEEEDKEEAVAEVEAEEGGTASPPRPPSPPTKDDDDAAAAAAPSTTTTAGLPPAAGACVVCADRPIQAVLIPCGHACTCRRCARRLARCPVCRTDLVRRQRLYVGG
jgi:hypothetical protein